MVPILSDVEVKKLLSMKEAISIIEDLINNKSLYSPPRSSIEIQEHDFIFTMGKEINKNIMGYRFYISKNGKSNTDQIITVYHDNNCKGIILGNYLGMLRTGAIGGVAIKKLSSINAKTLTVIGTGLQAEMQLKAALEVRDISSIKIFSRNEKNRKRFIEDFKNSNIIPIFEALNIKEAIHDADIIICATNSGVPLFQTSCLKESVHINSLGPKFNDYHEIDMSVIKEANVLVTDSLIQTENYSRKFFLSETSYMQKLLQLEDVKSEMQDKKSIFISTGLAGTEVALANIVLEKYLEI